MKDERFGGLSSCMLFAGLTDGPSKRDPEHFGGNGVKFP